jgi:hypothetical protein
VTKHILLPHGIITLHTLVIGTPVDEMTKCVCTSTESTTVQQRNLTGLNLDSEAFCCCIRKGQSELYAPSERAKLGLLCFLLLLMLGFLAFTAVNTVQAVRSFQQQYSAIKTGDVQAIRPWMTIHVISHVCHVPEDYLSRSLKIDNHHATLYEVAARKRQPVNQLIHTIQHAILAYRKEHPDLLTPTPAQHADRRPLSPTPGRTNY